VDEDIQTRWSQIRGRLASAGISLPEKPKHDGTIVDGARPGVRFGVWVMPDNSLGGMLEDFLGHLVPEGDPCWAYADAAVVEARRLGASHVAARHSKARIHTWLAWQEQPGLPFGTALFAHVLKHDSPIALAFGAAQK